MKPTQLIDWGGGFFIIKTKYEQDPFYLYVKAAFVHWAQYCNAWAKVHI